MATGYEVFGPLTLTTTDPGWQGYNFRALIATTDLVAAQAGAGLVRVTIEFAGTTSSATIDSMWVGEQQSSPVQPYNMDGNQVQMTFSGSTSLSGINGATVVVSDPIQFNFTGTSTPLVVSIHFSGTEVDARRLLLVNSGHFYLLGADSSSQSAPTGAWTTVNNSMSFGKAVEMVPPVIGWMPSKLFEANSFLRFKPGVDKEPIVAPPPAGVATPGPLGWQQPFEARFGLKPFWFKSLVPPTEVILAPTIPPVPVPKLLGWQQQFDTWPRTRPFWFKNLIPPTEVTFAPPIPPVPVPNFLGWQQQFDTFSWTRPFWFRKLVPPTEVTYAPIFSPVLTPGPLGWQQQFDTFSRTKPFWFKNLVPPTEVTYAPAIIATPVLTPGPLGWQQPFERRFQPRTVIPPTEATFVAPLIIPTLGWQQQLESPFQRRFQYRTTEITQAPIPPFTPTLGWQQQQESPPPARWFKYRSTEIAYVPIPAAGTPTPSILGWQVWNDRPAYQPLWKVAWAATIDFGWNPQPITQVIPPPPPPPTPLPPSTSNDLLAAYARRMVQVQDRRQSIIGESSIPIDEGDYTFWNADQNLLALLRAAKTGDATAIATLNGLREALAMQGTTHIEMLSEDPSKTASSRVFGALDWRTIWGN